ncbi:MAG: hypothetical protein QOH05_875, partial [Acetobacteraceae bacterium]|nr:hypothetical protein [Acetobacteraceae bacterium]
MRLITAVVALALTVTAAASHAAEPAYGP